MKEVFLWWGGNIVKAQVLRETNCFVWLDHEYRPMRFAKDEVHRSYHEARASALEGAFKEHRRLLNMVDRSNERISKLQKLKVENCGAFKSEETEA